MKIKYLSMPTTRVGETVLIPDLQEDEIGFYKPYQRYYKVSKGVIYLVDYRGEGWRRSDLNAEPWIKERKTRQVLIVEEVTF